MDSKAIERIEQLAAAAQTMHPDTEIPAAILPAGATVESLEHLLSTPLQMRMRYNTSRISDFCRYIAAEAAAEPQDAAVFIDPAGGAATGIMDYGTHQAPRWGKHRAQLLMQHTPEFEALLDASQQAHSQRSLIDWLEDWHHIITPFRGDEDIALARAISAIRRIDIKQAKSATHETTDWSASRSSMEEIEAKGATDALPDGFRVTCQLYPQTLARTAHVRLSLLTSDDSPRLRLRIVGLEQLRQDVADEIEELIATQLSAAGRADIRRYTGQVSRT